MPAGAPATPRRQAGRPGAPRDGHGQPRRGFYARQAAPLFGPDAPRSSSRRPRRSRVVTTAASATTAANSLASAARRSARAVHAGPRSAVLSTRSGSRRRHALRAAGRRVRLEAGSGRARSTGARARLSPASRPGAGGRPAGVRRRRRQRSRCGRPGDRQRCNPRSPADGGNTACHAGLGVATARSHAAPAPLRRPQRHRVVDDRGPLRRRSRTGSRSSSCPVRRRGGRSVQPLIASRAGIRPGAAACWTAWGSPCRAERLGVTYCPGDGSTLHRPCQPWMRSMCRWSCGGVPSCGAGRSSSPAPAHAPSSPRPRTRPGA